MIAYVFQKYLENFTFRLFIFFQSTPYYKINLIINLIIILYLLYNLHDCTFKFSPFIVCIDLFVMALK